MHQLNTITLRLNGSSARDLHKFIDAVGISDVPGTSGIDVKPPNVLLASAESGNLVAAASGNVDATAFDDDLVRRVDDENATFVHGDSTKNAAGLAC